MSEKQQCEINGIFFVEGLNMQGVCSHRRIGNTCGFSGECDHKICNKDEAKEQEVVT